MGTALGIPWQLRPAKGSELQAIFQAERDGTAFLIDRPPGGDLRITRAGDAKPTLTIGRNVAADLGLSWDDQVSGLHAEIQHLAGELTLVDDGLSRNGSYVNGERVHGRRRLRDGDMLRFGASVVQVRIPGDAERQATSTARESPGNLLLSPQQRRVLIALCRPLKNVDASAAPSTNQQVAEELSLSVAAVKMHLRALFEKFDVADLPQNQKRLALVRRALLSGLLTDSEFAAMASASAIRSAYPDAP
jgi:pSer/pThr/pTyr-binding forkhead associated (FHA) protein